MIAISFKIESKDSSVNERRVPKVISEVPKFQSQLISQNVTNLRHLTNKQFKLFAA